MNGNSRLDLREKHIGRRYFSFQSVRDLAIDVVIELRSQAAKTALLVMSVALSVGALISSIGISQNAAAQIDADLAASTNTLILVARTLQEVPDTRQVLREGQDLDGMPAPVLSFPADVEERANRLSTVAATGRILHVSALTTPYVTRSIDHTVVRQPRVDAATSGYLDAAEIDATSMAWMLDGNERIALVGEAAAEDLGMPVTRHPEGLSVTINGTQHSVVGFLPGEHLLTGSVVIPYDRGLSLVGSDVSTEILVRTELGAGNQISSVIRHQIMPENPTSLTASGVMTADVARSQVSTQLTQQVLWVGLFLLVLTILLIANSMVVSVTARTSEIGVRRALGSTRTGVSAVFWFEGMVIGLLGGLGGSTIASWVIVAAAAASSWTAHLNLVMILSGPLLGGLVGLIASAYPAIRASYIQPAIAVRAN